MSSRGPFQPQLFCEISLEFSGVWLSGEFSLEPVFGSNKLLFNYYKYKLLFVYISLLAYSQERDKRTGNREALCNCYKTLNAIGKLCLSIFFKVTSIYQFVIIKIFQSFVFSDKKIKTTWTIVEVWSYLEEDNKVCWWQFRQKRIPNCKWWFKNYTTSCKTNR